MPNPFFINLFLILFSSPPTSSKDNLYIDVEKWLSIVMSAPVDGEPRILILFTSDVSIKNSYTPIDEIV